MDGTTRYNKETEHLNNTINKLDLRDIHIIHHPTMAEYTLISSEHRSGHKTSFNNIKKIEIIQNIFSKRLELK